MTQKVSSNSIVSLDTSKLTGPHSNATDGSNLTNINDGMIESASDPTTSSNPNSGLGTLWVNHTSGEMYCCTNATTNANVWINVGAGTVDVVNQGPTDATNGGSFQNINENSSYNFTFSGATDDQPGFSYVVDQISNGVLSVSSAEVSSGSAHTFNTSSVGSDTAVTFRVRTKDSVGVYSSGVTVSTTVQNMIFTVTNATGTVSTGTSGNDRYHVFTGNGTLHVTQLDTVPTISYICVAGGGGGGGDQGGGGGAGGMISTTANLPSTGNYNIVIGAGAGSSTSTGPSGSNSSIIGPSFSQTAIGGGGGGGRYLDGVSGGSGGGGGSTGAARAGGSPTSGQGNAGGTTFNGKERAGGGGGKAAAGLGCNGSTNYPPSGGNGQLSNLDGSSYYYAGGGGGGFFHSSVQAGHGGLGGAGGGGKWSNYGHLVAPAGAQGRNAGGSGSQHGGYAGVNTGSGGGGGGWNYGGSNGGGGGSGIVIIRYTYQ